MSKSLCIGVLEDEVLIAEALTDQLRSLGYGAVSVANTFAEGVEMLGSATLDLLLLDINLKGDKDGVDFARLVRSQCAIPLIFITSHSDPGTVQRASEVKPNGYLVKPFNKERLYAAIETAVANFSEAAAPAPAPETALFVKEHNMSYTRLHLDALLWIRSEGNYLELHTANKRFLIRSSLRDFLTRYAHIPLVRTHKSHAVRLPAIEHIHHSTVTVAGSEIPLSRNFREQLLQKVERLG